MKKAIELKNVSKNFKIDKNKEVAAINNLSLSVKKGECLGIIGPNGSGKSTLLKLISEIYNPDKGVIKKEGRTLPFLQFGSGLKKDLTGRENIFLYGSLIGMTRKEIENNFDNIVDFSGLKEFIDVKLKKYSTGMVTRLIFSTAMVKNPKIILIDEMLSVGDYEFQTESLNKIKILKNEGKTILFVSHDLFLVRQICDRVICLKKGEIVNKGDPYDVIRYYLDLIKRTKLEKSKDDLESKYKNYKRLNKHIKKVQSDKNKSVLLSGLINKYNEIRISELKQKLKILESNLIEHIDLLLLDSEYILEELWEEYKAGKKKSSLEKIKHINQAINIKTNITELSQREFEIKSALYLYLIYTEKENIEHTKKFVRMYENKIRKTKNNRDKRKILDRIYFLLMELELENIKTKSYSYIMEEYVAMLLKNKIHDSKTKIENIGRYHRIQLDRLIYDLEVKSSDGSKENKKRLEEFKKLKEVVLEHCNIKRKKSVEDAEKKVLIKKVLFLDKKNRERDTFHTGDTLKIKIEYEAKEKIKNPVFGVGIFHENGTHVSGPNTKTHNIEIPHVKGTGSITYIIQNLPLLNGKYLISVVIHPGDSFEPYDIHEKKYSIKIKNKKINGIGLVQLNSDWEIE